MIPAEHITGLILGSQLAADAIDGKVITGSVVRSLRGNGSVAAVMAPDLGNGEAGFQTTSEDGTTYARLQSGEMTFGSTTVDQVLPTGIRGTAQGGTLDIMSGLISGGSQAHIILASGDSPVASGDGAPAIVMEWDGAGTADMVVDVSGVLMPRNFAWGKVSITPVANTPTPMTVTGLNVRGSNFTGFATVQSTVPGTVVTGVGVTAVSKTSITVWVTRTNTTATTVAWEVRGDK
ncbi:hypothetical protein [Streptomyces griseoaurantiacus]|uniref:hypothetical protein n=1 Tax=Streptomyces griseoaurantiacus TaxID=68213 RepID=UPI0030E57836